MSRRERFVVTADFIPHAFRAMDSSVTRRVDVNASDFQLCHHCIGISDIERDVVDASAVDTWLEIDRRKATLASDRIRFGVAVKDTADVITGAPELGPDTINIKRMRIPPAQLRWPRHFDCDVVNTSH
jgi:hypothetical protein